MSRDDQMLTSLQNVRELEAFLLKLLESPGAHKLRHGENVLAHCEKTHVPVPDSLRGVEITWDTETEFGKEFADGPPLVLVQPGRPDALGLTIGCVRFGRFKVCLECGWLWCRIVIKGRF